MIRYIIKRLLLMIPVIIGVAILIFTIMYFVPGDPAQIIMGQSATVQQVAAKRADLGLNLPYIVQLAQFLKLIFLKLNFGTSYFSGTSVLHEIIVRFPRTLTIAFFSMAFSVLVGLPLGIIAAVHRNTWRDSVSMLISLTGISMPPFWFGIMVVLLFAVKFRVLPAGGIGSPAYYVLPIISCSLGGIATIARQTRSSMLEVIRADYIATARAKGQTERKVIYSHALRNALIPIITVAGTQFGVMIGGALIVETVFSIPGIGMYMMSGLNSRDYPVVRGCVIFTAILFSLIMLMVDLIYAYVDPRIKGQYASSKSAMGKVKVKKR